MTDHELKRLVASLAAKQDWLDAQPAATDRQVAETSRKLEAIDIRVANVSQNQGAVAG